MSKCNRDAARRALDLIKDEPASKSLGYVKRSLELIEDGSHNGSIVYDKNGKVSAAAAWFKDKDYMRLDTMGSIGKYDKKTGLTPGAIALKDFLIQSQDMKGVKAYAENPYAAQWYKQRTFQELNKNDARDLTALPEHFMDFVAWVTSREKK